MTPPLSKIAAEPGRLRSVLLALAVFAVALAAIFGVYSWHRVATEETDRLSNLTRLAAGTTQFFYAQYESALSDLATELNDEGIDEIHARRMLQRLEHSTPGLRQTTLTDAAGNLIVSTHIGRSPVRDTESVESFIPFSTRDPNTLLEFARPIRVPGTGEWLVPLRFRIADRDGKSPFVISALVSLEEQWRGLSELQFPRHFVIGIARDDGYLQGRWPQTNDTSATFAQALNGPITQRKMGRDDYYSGTFVDHNSPTGEKQFNTYQVIPGTPLTLYVSMPYSTLWAQWLERVQAPYLLIISMALAAIWAQRRISQQHRLWSHEVAMRQTRLELLHSLRSGLANNTSIEHIVGRTLEKLAARYPQRRVRYGVLQANGKVQHIASRSANGASESNANTDYSTMPEYLSQLLSGIVGAVADRTTDARFSSREPGGGDARAMLDAPLAHNESQIGLLGLESTLPHQWSEDEIATISEVAGQLSLVLREAQAAEARTDALKQLGERERAFRSIAELSSDWFWEQDEQLRFKAAPRYSSIAGDTHLIEAEYVGKTRWELPRTQFNAEALRRHREALARREPFRVLECERTMPDGSVRYVQLSGVPLFDESGRFTGYHGIGKEITEQKKSELALRESEATLSAIFHATHDAMFIVDLDNSAIIDCNHRALETFDATNAAAIRNLEGAWSQRLPINFESAKVIKAHLEHAEFWRQEIELVSQKGRYFWGDVSVVKLYLPDRALHLLRVADITERRRAEEALRSSEAIFSAVFNSSRDALFLGNIANGTVMECNPRAVELFEAPDKDAILSRPGHTLLRHPLSRVRLGETLGKLEYGEILREDMMFRSHGGRKFWGEMVAVKLESPLNHVYLVRVADISERKQSETKLRASEQRFRDLSELSSDWFWEQDSDLRYTLLSNSALRAGERVDDNPYGKRRWEIDRIADLDDPKWAQHRQTLEAHKPFYDFVYRYRTDSGMRWASISGVPLFDDQGRFTGYRGVGSDITDRKLSEDRIRYLAQHDDLTGLYNRASFHNTLSRAVDQARRHNRRLAVLFIDLDRFKNINDTLGHDAGDAVLKEIAARLRSCLRESDIVARQGGDEFVVLLEDFGTDNDLSGVARKVLYAFSQPFALGSKEFMLTASVGIGTFPDDAQDMSSLLKAADIAMYRAKETGRNNFQFYSPQMNVHSLERLQLEASLKRALERGELRLHYQPKLDLVTGRIAGTEALLRWEHPDNGMIPPLQFIPIAEETGLIAPIGAWVLLEACRQLNTWHEAGWGDLTLAVNLSARQFMQDSLVEEILAALRYSNMTPRFLELEITESTVMQKPERAAKVLEELHRLGLSIAIDDFGTGHSSLAYLRRFPVSTLKIDRSFIRDVPFDAEDVEITRAIIALGRSLHLRVVGEGVETAAQRDFLATAGCDEAQGFLIGKPMPPAEFERFMQQHEVRPALVTPAPLLRESH